MRFFHPVFFSTPFVLFLTFLFPFSSPPLIIIFPYTFFFCSKTKNILSLFTPRTKPSAKMSLHQKKKREITNVHIHGISSTALKQIASEKQLNNNNQQQPPPNHHNLEKKSHSQSSNRINFSDQAQNSS